jgi:hypothetical protein
VTAAVSPSTPTGAEVAAAVECLVSKDSGTLAVVERLARSLTREEFERALKKLERRRQSTTDPLLDDAAYLVSVLKLALREQARLRAAARVDPLARASAEKPPSGFVERVKREEPERYIAAMVKQMPDFDVERYLACYVSDESERQRLRRLAA